MRAIIIHNIALLFFSTILATVPGCDDSLDFTNTPPGGLAITRDKCYLGPLDSVNLVGQASDADGDSISYSWTAEAGTLTPADGRGQAVTWQAPDSHGTYRVTLKVTDGLDDSSKGIDLDIGRNLDVLHDGGILDQTDYPYIVPNVLPMKIGEMLTVRIEAGVTIVFNEGTSGLDIEGTLIINGTQQDRVLFTPNKCPGEDRVWKGIKIHGSRAPGGPSQLNYVTITSTADGLTVEDGASVTADNIIIDQTTADAVSVKTGGNITLMNSRIWDNGAGIYVANGTLEIQSSSIRYNGNYGFSLLSMDVTVRDCVVANNGQYGFVLATAANPVVNNCSIFFNGPTGRDGRTVMLSTGYSGTNIIDMTGNYWGTTSPQEIARQIDLDGASTTVDYSGWLTDPPAQD